MGNSQSISLLSYGVDDTVLPSDPVNENFGNFLDNFTDIDDGLYVEDDELLGIVFNIISKDAVLRSILNMVDDRRVSKKAKISRFVYPRRTTEELWDTVWGKRISVCREDISTGGVNPYSRVQAEFRADFRVPFTFFEEIVVECKEAQIFTTGYKRPTIPDEFKVLTVLRILGRNYVAASVKEILGCGMSTINVWFKRFCKRYSDYYYSKYVYIPTGAALNEVEKVYRWMGFPGCVGSMDVTHLHLSNCPAELRHHCIGRYGYPTLGFNFICSHNRRIQHICKPFYGATNDITVTYNDNYPRRLMLCEEHTDRVFRTYNRLGDITYWRGAYLITDGGYPTCYSFLNPNLLNYDYHTVVWGEWLEAERKDVERLFGTLKSRFRWLSSSIQYHNHVTIHNAVKVCAILHNRLLEYDNMLDFDWGNIDPNTDVDDLVDKFLASRITPPEPEIIVDPDLPEPSQDKNSSTILLNSPEVVPSTLPVIEVEEADDAINFSNSNHIILKRALIKHFQYAYTNGNIHWPKQFSKTQKKKMPLLQVRSFLLFIYGRLYGNLLF